MLPRAARNAVSEASTQSPFEAHARMWRLRPPSSVAAMRRSRSVMAAAISVSEQ